MKENYIDFVHEHIELDKLLASTDPKYHEQIKKLLEKKKTIIEKNGFFAGFQLNKINKKIKKIRNKK
jgi:hypothetical protein